MIEMAGFAASRGRLDGSNSETHRLYRLLLMAIERADFLEPFLQRRDEV